MRKSKRANPHRPGDVDVAYDWQSVPVRQVSKRRGRYVRIVALLYALVIGIAGCASAPRRWVDQTPVMSQYKGWTIRVTPSVIHGSPNLWRAGVRVWPPEVRAEAHPGIDLSFSDAATERRAVEQAATAAARRYIDSSVSTH
jgi:hypothetical protein